MLDKDSLNSEISVGVTFASLMAAISLFFTGVLITSYESFGSTIQVPLLFLIVSTFSFIFAATIYNNAGTEVTLGKLKTTEKYMIYAKNIVEFLGLYPLIIATPLVIGAATEDNFLRTSTVFVAVVGMALYSQSKFSILEKQLTESSKRLYSLLIVILSLALYMAQAIDELDSVMFYTSISVVLLATLLIPAVYFSFHSKHYRAISIRPYRANDDAALVRIIEKVTRRAKRNKLPAAMIEAMNEAATPKTIHEMAKQTTLLVAVSGSRRAGFVSYSGNQINQIFTDPDLQRKGIGRMLADAAEFDAAEQGHEEMLATTMEPHDRFFKRLDYDESSKTEDGQVTLTKDL